MGRSKVNRYCYSCGGEVVVSNYIYAYDEYTGRPQTVEVVKCPKRRWYHLGHYVTQDESYAMHE